MCNAYNTHCFCSVLKNNVLYSPFLCCCKCLNELLLVHLELSQCNINIENCCFLCYKHTLNPHNTTLVIACNLILKHFSHLMRLHLVHELKRSILINTIEWILQFKNDINQSIGSMLKAWAWESIKFGLNVCELWVKWTTGQNIIHVL